MSLMKIIIFANFVVFIKIVKAKCKIKLFQIDPKTLLAY